MVTVPLATQAGDACLSVSDGSMQ